jgi:hypothetical protein
LLLSRFRFLLLRRRPLLPLLSLLMLLLGPSDPAAAALPARALLAAIPCEASTPRRKAVLGFNRGSSSAVPRSQEGLPGPLQTGSFSCSETLGAGK